MIIEDIKLKKLVASEGKVLTDGNTYAKVHFLADGDKPENWHEITDAEYAEIVKAEEEKNKCQY